MSRILTVYYVAEFIQRSVGGELFEIDTVRPYATDYRACAQEAQQELRANARPELKAFPESLEQYDALFVGYPNWWDTCPMAVFTFLEHFDLTGKQIISFCANEGSGMGRSEQDGGNGSEP